MKPLAEYTFTKKSSSVYLFKSCTGADFLPLPVYVRGANKGGRYIKFERRRKKPRPNHRNYEYAFSLGKNERGSSICLTGVNFSTAYPNKTFGDDKNIGRNDAILFEFSEDGQELTLYVFDGQADNAGTLFERWTAGKLCLTADPLPLKKESPSDSVKSGGHTLGNV